MNSQYDNVNVMMNGNYFDITHSFKIDSSTYHVLGLRKDRPTYGNTYYIFNCGCESFQFREHRSNILPFIHHSTSTKHQSYSHNHQIKSRKTNEISAKSIDDIARIEKTLKDILKTEHKSLINSFREEKDILLQSIEKETKIITQITTQANSQKQEAFRMFEEKISTLERIFERHTSTILSSMELLKTSINDTLNIHRERLQSFDEVQLKFSEIIEREVEKVMVKHIAIYKSTLTDINIIKDLQNTLIQLFEQHISTKEDSNNKNNNNNNDDSIKYLLSEQTQNLTSIINKHQQTYSLDSKTIIQLQNTIVETMEKLSTTKRDDNNNADILNHLFAEQRQYLNELMAKQQQRFSLDLIKETIISTLNEHKSTATHTSTSSIDVAQDRHPFKLSIKTSEFAHVYATLLVNGIDCSNEGHTICQRDPFEDDVVNCFVAPPIKNQRFQLTIYAKTNTENQYRAALSVEMPHPNMAESVTFPFLYQAFKDHQCILIEPFRGQLRLNEPVLIHMITPDICEVKIRNGNEHIILNKDEFRHHTIKKKIRVQGDIVISGQWNGKHYADICSFNAK